LRHRVSIEKNLITGHQIIAPTNATFLNNGVVATGLIGAAATNNLARTAK